MDFQGAAARSSNRIRNKSPDWDISLLKSLKRQANFDLSFRSNRLITQNLHIALWSTYCQFFWLRSTNGAWMQNHNFVWYHADNIFIALWAELSAYCFQHGQQLLLRWIFGGDGYTTYLQHLYNTLISVILSWRSRSCFNGHVLDAIEFWAVLLVFQETKLITSIQQQCCGEKFRLWMFTNL